MFTIKWFYSLVLSLILPSYLTIFAPLLTILYTTTSYAASLWASLLIGLYFDCMASKLPLGFYSLSYCIATTLVFRYRRFFLLEKWWIFPLYTAIFSFAFTIVEMLLLILFNAKLPIHFTTILSDLGVMPIVDALFALLFFSLPYALWKYLTNSSRIHYLREKWKTLQN